MHKASCNLVVISLFKLIFKLSGQLSNLTCRIHDAPVLALHFDEDLLVRDECYQLNRLEAFIAEEGKLAAARVQLGHEGILLGIFGATLGNHELLVRVINVLARLHGPLLRTVLELFIRDQLPRVAILEIQCNPIHRDAVVCDRDS